MSIIFAMLLQVAPGAQSVLDTMATRSAEWKACTAREAKAMAVRSREAADVIADAAVASCPDEEAAMRLASRRASIALGQPGALGDGVIDKAKVERRGELLSIIIKAR